MAFCCETRLNTAGSTYLLSAILFLILTSVLLPSLGKSARSVTPAANKRKITNRIGKQSRIPRRGRHRGFLANKYRSPRGETHVYAILRGDGILFRAREEENKNFGERNIEIREKKYRARDSLSQLQEAPRRYSV